MKRTNQNRNRIRKNLLRQLLLGAVLALLLSGSALAASTGWKTNASWTRLVYYKRASNGSVVKATGLTKIGSCYFYFDKSGALQTGWVSTNNGLRYFQTWGKAGTKGRMYTGIHVIGKYTYGFAENGLVLSGLHEIDGYEYYFSASAKAGKAGRRLASRFVKLSDGRTVYLGKYGAVLKSQWLTLDGKTYYLGEDGGRLTGWQTIGGKTYYFDSDGVRVTGKVKIDGTTYRFSARGVLKSKAPETTQTDSGKTKTDSGKTKTDSGTGTDSTGTNGTGTSESETQAQTESETQAQTESETQTQTQTESESDADDSGSDSSSDKPRVLIIAGHGQGDPGAVSSWGQEQTYTRQFARLIVKALRAGGEVSVKYFNSSYDCYTQVLRALNKAGIQGAVTGSGTYKTRVIKALKANSVLPDFTDYDYVLEIHFNAKGTGKDVSGDGTITGVGIMMNTKKSDRTIDRKIVQAIASTGMAVWGRGTGLFPSSTLLNARTMQEIGVSYSLLETCFIDDGDDMKFYKAHKSEMAQAVADAIEACLTD